jgi:hypothetical protein
VKEKRNNEPNRRVLRQAFTKNVAGASLYMRVHAKFIKQNQRGKDGWAIEYNVSLAAESAHRSKHLSSKELRRAQTQQHTTQNNNTDANSDGTQAARVPVQERGAAGADHRVLERRHEDADDGTSHAFAPAAAVTRSCVFSPQNKRDLAPTTCTEKRARALTAHAMHATHCPPAPHQCAPLALAPRSLCPRALSPRLR